jgi:hypothetical protein
MIIGASAGGLVAARLLQRPGIFRFANTLTLGSQGNVPTCLQNEVEQDSARQELLTNGRPLYKALIESDAPMRQQSGRLLRERGSGKLILCSRQGASLRGAGRRGGVQIAP